MSASPVPRTGKPSARAKRDSNVGQLVRRNVTAACAATLAISLLAGCHAAGKGVATGDAPAPTLAQRLNAMPPEEQLDTLRVLEKEKPGDATVAFHFGNAYY